MITKAKNIFIAVLIASGSGVAGAGEFDDAYAAVDAKRKQAASLGFEWRDTGKIMKQAKKAMGKGEMEKAKKLLAKAEFQSKRAIEQAEYEQEAWKSRVIQ
ncbi:MAG: hypothetical protein ACNYPI_06660 [Arenicellales bacterium WSBS_2016_MAG_OTU3]